MKWVADVFSVRLAYDRPTQLEPRRHIFGYALLVPGDNNGDSVLFRWRTDDRPVPKDEPQKRQIRETGWQDDVKLTGPKHGVQVKDELAIYTYLWSMRLGPMFDLDPKSTLWKVGVDETDQLVCREANTIFGPLEVNFAVYSDGIEAHLEVELVDWNASDDGVKAYGTVGASNSTIREAKGRSILFDRQRSEAISVKPRKEEDIKTDLPLSRSVIVVPRESTLFVDVSIWQLDSSHADSQPIFQTLSFDAKLTGNTQTQVASGDCGLVQVRVNFSGL